MENYSIKTMLAEGEEVVFCHAASVVSNVTSGGNIIVTNKRFIWMRKPGLNLMEMGGLVRTGKRVVIVPREEIGRIDDCWFPMAAGIRLVLKSGKTYIFQIGGSRPKEAREMLKHMFNTCLFRV